MDNSKIVILYNKTETICNKNNDIQKSIIDVELDNTVTGNCLLSVASNYEQIRKCIVEYLDLVDASKNINFVELMEKLSLELVTICSYFIDFSILNDYSLKVKNNEAEVIKLKKEIEADKLISEDYKLKNDIINIKKLTESIEYKKNEIEILEDKKDLTSTYIFKLLYGLDGIKLMLDCFFNIHSFLNYKQWDSFERQFLTIKDTNPYKKLFYLEKSNYSDLSNIHLPNTIQLLCIKEGNRLVSTDKLYFLKDEKGKYDEFNKENYKKRIISFIEHKEVIKINVYEVTNIIDMLFLEYNYIIDNGIVVRKCKNCGKYFIPRSKANETLCDNIFKKNKTCKELSSELKLENDEISKIFRGVYKTQNAKKSRNKDNIQGIQDKFEKWNIKAKQQREKCRNGEITIEQFKKWLKDNENWHKEALK